MMMKKNQAYFIHQDDGILRSIPPAEAFLNGSIHIFSSTWASSYEPHYQLTLIHTCHIIQGEVRMHVWTRYIYFEVEASSLMCVGQSVKNDERGGMYRYNGVKKVSLRITFC